MAMEQQLTEELQEMNDMETQEGIAKKKKLPNWIIIPIVLGMFLFVFILSKLSTGEKPSSTEVDVVTVTKGDVKEEYSISGTIESDKTKVFYSPVNAPILGVYGKLGEAVVAGELLISFDTKDLEKDNRQSELSALSTKYSNAASLEAQSKTAEQAKEAAQALAKQIQSLKKQIANKETEVNTLKKQVETDFKIASSNAANEAKIQSAMQTNLNNQDRQTQIKEVAENNLENVDPASPTASAERTEYTNTINAVVAELADLKIAYRSLEQQLANLGTTDSTPTQVAYATALQELEAMKVSLTELENQSNTTEDYTMTSSQLKGMQVSEDLASLALMSTEELVALGREGVKAEFDGVISDMQAIVGTGAAQGGALFTLASMKDVSVAIEIPVNDYEKIKMDTKATIKLGDHTYQGSVTELSKIATDNAQGNSVIHAVVNISNPDENICIGVKAKLVMTVAEKKNVLCLPTEVINTANDGDFVYVIVDGIIKKQSVELGISSSNTIEVIRGLEEGDQVVLDTLGTVQEGNEAVGVEKEEEE